MSKYAEDECFKKADAQFIYWTKTELRLEINNIKRQISILNETVALVESELYSRNLQLYQLSDISRVVPEPSGRPNHESV